MTDLTRPARKSGYALVMALAAACAGGEEAGPSSVPGVTDSTVTVGTWTPLTGPAALWGAVGRGVEGYFRMINDEEGGINGRRINVIVRDDGYQPSRTVTVVREMAERDGVFAFVGSVGTATSLAVKGYLEEQGIPFISPATGNHSFTQPPSPIIYSTFGLYVDEAAALVGFAVDSLGLSRLAVIHQNDDFGRSGVVGVQLALEERGLTTVAEVPVEVTDADLSSHVLRLQEADADGVLLWITPRHAAIVRNAAGRMDFRPQWFASTVLGDIDLMMEITNGAWAGTIGTTTIDAVSVDDPRLERYVNAMRRYSPDEGSPWFYIGGMSVAELAGEGLRRAGRDLTRDSFLDAIAGLGDWKGELTPPSHFSPEQHLGTRSVILYRVTADGGVPLTGWVVSNVDLSSAIERLR